MSTDYHTEIATGVVANSATVNNPLGEIDAAIDAARSDVDIPIRAFISIRGAPAQGSVGYGFRETGTWLLDDASSEAIGAAFVYRGTAAKTLITISLFWSMVSATSGDVVFLVSGQATSDGSDITAEPDEDTDIITVPGTAGLIKKTTFTIADNIYSGDVVKITIQRTGGSGSDTATGDMNAIACRVRLT